MTSELEKADREHAEKVKKLLLSALGTDGLMIRDNDVELLIDLLDAYLHGMFDEDE